MTHGQTGDPDDMPAPRRTDCREGGRCDGSGWVQVTPDYARVTNPYPPDLPLDASDDETADHARQCRRVDAARKAAETAVYPCKDCNTRAFFRWAGGHWRPGHDTASCTECVEAIPTHRRRRAS